MNISLILTVALASAMIVIVLVLVAVVVYQRWQIGDKNATLARFIDENERMRRKMERMGIA
jgi:cytochrome c-type biogenesis protein CcmH/NrfG